MWRGLCSTSGRPLRPSKIDISPQMNRRGQFRSMRFAVANREGLLSLETVFRLHSSRTSFITTVILLLESVTGLRLGERRRVHQGLEPLICPPHKTSPVKLPLETPWNLGENQGYSSISNSFRATLKGYQPLRNSEGRRER